MKILPSPALVPSAMSAGGEVHDNSLGGAGAGSVPISAPNPVAAAPEVLPLPQLGAQLPVHMQAGKHGAAGLRPAPPQPPEDSADGPPWPAGDQGLKEGSLAPWHKTPGF